MAKKRTKKEKLNPHHNFTLSWNNAGGVKGQKNIGSKSKFQAVRSVKNADLLAKDASASNIKHDLLKSLIAVSFILCLEIVIYLAWK